MAKNFKKVYEEFMNTLSYVSSEPEYWLDFLTVACRNYKLRFDEQILVYSQKPTATAVATYEQWQKLYRPINKGEKSIVVFQYPNGRGRNLKYYFDIADTHITNYSRPVPIWEMQSRYEQDIISALEENFGKSDTETTTFENSVISLTEKLAREYTNEFANDLSKNMGKSNLEKLPFDEARNIFNTLVSKSVAYSVSSRLKINTSDFFNSNEFSDITLFNTKNSLLLLGTATQEISAMAIFVIADKIKNNAKEEQKNEAIQRNDTRRKNPTQSHSIGKQEGQRTSLTRTGNRGASEEVFLESGSEMVHTSPIGILHPGTGRRGRGTGRNTSQTGTVLNTPQGVSGRNEPNVSNGIDNNGRNQPTPKRNSRAWNGNGVKTNQSDGQERGLDRGTQSQGPVGLGGAVQQPQAFGTGNSSERVSIRLNNNEISQKAEVDENSASAFSLPEENNSDLYSDKFFIYSDTERINWLYYNPDSDAGGQFVTNEFYFDDILLAVENSSTPEEFFSYIEGICNQTLSDVGTIWYEEAYSEFNEVPTFIGCTDETMNSLISVVNKDKNLELFGKWEFAAVLIDKFTNDRELREIYTENNDTFRDEVKQRIHKFADELLSNREHIQGYSRYDIMQFITEYKHSNHAENMQSEVENAVVTDIETAFEAIENAKSWAKENDTPFVDKFVDGEYEFDPYVYDGSMTSEDFEKAQELVLNEEGENENEIRKIQSDTLEFSFGNDKEPAFIIDNGEYFNNFTESELLYDFVYDTEIVGGQKISFALANAVLEYLDEKQHIERQNPLNNFDNPEYHVGWYKKTDFSIKAIINGEEFNYQGRFDIGDGKSSGGGTLIEHITNHTEWVVEKSPYPYKNSAEEIAEYKRYMDILIPFLEANSELNPQEKEIFERFKADNPIRDFGKTEKQLQDEIHNIAVTFGANEELLREIINLNPNEHSLNEFGRFGKFLDTMDKAKAREYFEKEENSKLSPIKVNAKLRKFLRDFILNYEPVQKASEQHEVDNTTEESESEKTEEYEKIANFNEGKNDFNLADYEIEEVGKVERYNRNIAAIQTLKTCEFEERQATPEEQELLSKYVGWGGIPEAFDSNIDNLGWIARYHQLQRLFTKDEYNDARASTRTAFYTPPVVIKAIYQGLSQLGFKNGKILEPSCGVGNFIGMIPPSMQGSKVYGVEIDSVTARIAQQLYQTADIANLPFQNTSFPDNYFDIAVGNVPFDNFQVNDRRYNKYKFQIHDYFFAKTLDKVKPGGIIAFISSKGTMDKKNPSVRRYIAQRAELLGAIRLPDDTFGGNANTKVTSDILFLQKREKMIDIEPNWVHLNTDENGIEMNSYFIQHPEMVLGEMVEELGRYGISTACKHIEGTELSALLDRAIKNIDGKIAEFDYDELDSDDLSTIPADPSVANYSFTIYKDQIYYRQDAVMELKELSPKEEKIIRAFLPLRDCVRTLINLQTEDYPDEVIKQHQGHLNSLYDSFVSDFGRIGDKNNVKAFSSDSSYSLLLSLEHYDDEGKFVRKADMFTQRTIRPSKPITHVDTAQEALALSLGTRACVDHEYMQELTGLNESELYSNLERAIFINPLYSENNSSEYKYLPRDEYLSGNVREKLKIAKLAEKSNPVFTVNVQELENVQPKELVANEIFVRLGTTWIDDKYITQFVHELLKVPRRYQDEITVHYSDITGLWRVEGKSRFENIESRSIYGTDRINAYQIIEQSLNLKTVTVKDAKIENDKTVYVVNEKETIKAQAKQKQIEKEFRKWIFDPTQERSTELVNYYNENFNVYHDREFDGSHLMFEGKNQEITLRKHQLNAVARIIYGGNTLLAHAVGAGKTFEMVAAAQESKRLGLCTKSLIVVPKHLIKQWEADYMRLYPTANILVAREKDFSGEVNRKTFLSRIATGEYDSIIIGQTQLENIPMSLEFEAKCLEKEIEDITNSLSAIKANNGERFSVKQLEGAKKKLEERLKNLLDSNKRYNGITFEELGIDMIFVDESHYYKNLFTYTKMSNVNGISTTGSKKASHLYMITQYLNQVTNGRGVVFATGTPISNSMVEMYSILRYLAYNKLERMKMTSFDAWASTFGETVTDYELTPEGTGYQMKTRFAKFINIPELLSLYRSVADIMLPEMLNLDVPLDIRETITLEPSEHQKAMIQGLAKRAKNFRNRVGNAPPQEMLLITMEGRKLALDQRIINPLLSDYEDSKANACAKKVFEVYTQTTNIKGTQLIFCDQATPNGKSNDFNIYDDIKNKLIAMGIPQEEMKFIHNANSDKDKDKLFRQVRNGDVRILLGSTLKMGAGTNVQTKLVALHHLDCPWTPANLEQREGRIIRQGNENKEVSIYTYITEKTFDAYSYQTLVRKQKFISQVMTSQNPLVRSYEDIDDRAMSFSEIMAIATGDTRIKRVSELEREISEISIEKSDFERQQHIIQKKVDSSFPEEISRLEKTISGIKNDIMLKNDNPKPIEDFVGITINKTFYPDKKVAGETLLTVIKEIDTVDEDVQIGKYRGFSLAIHFNAMFKSYQAKLIGSTIQRTDLGTDPIGNITRIDNAIEKLPQLLQENTDVLADLKEQLERAKEHYHDTFGREKELTEKMNELNTLQAELMQINESFELNQKDTDSKKM